LDSAHLLAENPPSSRAVQLAAGKMQDIEKGDKKLVLTRIADAKSTSEPVTASSRADPASGWYAATYIL